MTEKQKTEASSNVPSSRTKIQKSESNGRRESRKGAVSSGLSAVKKEVTKPKSKPSSTQKRPQSSKHVNNNNAPKDDEKSRKCKHESTVKKNRQTDEVAPKHKKKSLSKGGKDIGEASTKMKSPKSQKDIVEVSTKSKMKSTENTKDVTQASTLLSKPKQKPQTRKKNDIGGTSVNKDKKSSRHESRPKSTSQSKTTPKIKSGKIEEDSRIVNHLYENNIFDSCKTFIKMKIAKS